MSDEAQRIIEAYHRLDTHVSQIGRFFGYEGLAHVTRVHERYRETLRILKSAAYHPLTHLRVLDVGCGNGAMLQQFVLWGAQPENLAGIELRSEPVATSHHLYPNLDVRCNSAVELPWLDNAFDLVCQHTVFTSILDKTMKQQVANEMVRVLRPGGAILWYDFMYNNPRNPDVRGVKREEIERLFPSLNMKLRRVTLAPPIARRIPAGWLPVAYPLLATFPFLRTHYLGLLIKAV
jgi:SAM-dependent methyltransferase